MSRKKRSIKSGSSDLQNGTSFGFDVIGDIAVVNLPLELIEYNDNIASSIVSARKNVRTVLNRTKSAEGGFRIPGYELIFGDPNTITIHREAGFSYMLDIRDSFFNPRLCTERMRVNGLVRKNEVILVPFAGVGPFAIPAGAKGATVYSIEMNPSACRWLKENVKLNRVNENIEVILADAELLPDMVDTKFDRAIVPTPYGFDDSLFIIARMVKKGGKIHFYTFKRPGEIHGMRDLYERSGFCVQNIQRCGNVAKGVSRWVFDLKKK